MDKNEIYATDQMLKGISMAAKSKKLVSSDRQRAVELMYEAINLMNGSIKMCPNNIENRKIRFRHLLGITIESPKKCLEEIEDDFNFFSSRFDTLSDENRSFFCAAAGDYMMFLGDRDKALSYLNRAKELAPGTLNAKLAALTLEKICKT